MTKIYILDESIAKDVVAQGGNVQNFTDVNGVPFWMVICEGDAFNLKRFELEDKVLIYDNEPEWL